MKNLHDHNQEVLTKRQKAEQLRLIGEPSGVACPTCELELRQHEPDGEYPMGYRVSCPGCGYTGRKLIDTMGSRG